MCRLKLKLKIVGSKHHKFKKLIVIPRNNFINSLFKKKLGIWDSRVNKFSRYIVLNIYSLMTYYRLGLTPNKKTLNIIYYYLIKKVNVDFKCYFSRMNMKRFLENEIKQKCFKKY